MPGLLSRRKPWPYHFSLNGVGCVLVPSPQSGLMVESQAVTGDEVTPTAFDYGAYSPFVEKPYVFGRLVGGMGEAVQRSATPVRYKRAKNADLSIGGIARLGPYFAPEVLSAPAVTQMTQFLAAASTWWAFRGRYVFKRTAPAAWALDSDFGSLAYVNQATTYAPVGGSFGQIYAASGGSGSGLWNWNGVSTWTQCTLPVGMNAQWVERNQAELWIADATNVIRKTTGDPLTGAGAWGGPIYVGDASAPITGLKSLHGQIFVFKTDGVYSVNTDGSVNDLFPEFRLTGTRSTNGSATAIWRDRLWFRFGDGYYYLTGGSVAAYTPIGPERLLEQTGVRGVPVAFVGHGAWFGYLALYDALANVSYLLKYGTWVPSDDGGAVPGYQFAEVWHGSVKEWTGKQVTTLGVEGPVVVAPNLRPNPWLWVGFADGTIEYTPLPVLSPDPAGDAACQFTTEEAYVDWPDHHAMAQADVKHFRTFVGQGPRLDAQNYAAVSYRTDPNAALAPLAQTLTATGLRASTPAAGVTGTTLQVREYLVGTRTTTPQVESVTLLEQVRPAMLLKSEVVVRAARNLARRDGLVDRRTGEKIRAALQAVVDGSKAPGAGPVTAIFPDETSQQIDAVDYAAVLAPNGHGLSWDVRLKLVQFVSNTTYGTWSRVAGHTWGDLAAYTWGMVPSL